MTRGNVDKLYLMWCYREKRPDDGGLRVSYVPWWPQQNLVLLRALLENHFSSSLLNLNSIRRHNVYIGTRITYLMSTTSAIYSRHDVGLVRQAVAYSGACPVPVSQTEPKWPCKWLFQWINDTRPRQLKICPTCSWFSADCNCPCPRKINVHQAMLLFASRDATEAIREGDESLAQTNKKASPLQT